MELEAHEGPGAADAAGSKTDAKLETEKIDKEFHAHAADAEAHAKLPTDKIDTEVSAGASGAEPDAKLKSNEAILDGYMFLIYFLHPTLILFTTLTLHNNNGLPKQRYDFLQLRRAC